MNRHFALGCIVALAVFIACGFGGCPSRQVQEKIDSNTAQASANLHAVGDHLETTGRDAEGRAVNSQTDIIDDALGIPETNRRMATVTQEEWDAAMSDNAAKEKLADQLGREKEQLTGELEKARADAVWYRNLTNSAAVAGVVGVLGAVGSAFGMPFLAPIGRIICRKGFQKLEGQVAELQSQNGVAMTTVAASDIGREALALLDSKLAAADPKIRESMLGAIQAITGRQVGSIEDYFKTFARSAAVDAGYQGEVDQLLRTIRDDQDTAGGLPKAFLDVLSALQKRAA